MLRSDQPLNLMPASVGDYRESARKRLPRQLFDYIDGGAYEETTMRANSDNLTALQLRQRVLRDVSECQLGVSVLGQEMSMPVALAPVGLAGMFGARAEVAAAKAAETAGVPFCESTVSICSIEEVAAAVEPPPWFQLYVMRDRDYGVDLMERAQAVGCEVLVLTVDLAVVGARYRDVRNGMSGDPSPYGQVRNKLDIVGHPRWVKDVVLGGRPLTFGNLVKAVPDGKMPNDFAAWVGANFDPSVTWADIDWVREHWKGKVVLKGILDSADALEAAERGVDAIVVSNHGGRQLDAVPSTVEALPPIVSAVGGSMEILVDGGIRSGLDVLKMLALGADATLIGRPWAWAVASGGQAAVENMLSTLRAEMVVAMALTGATDVKDLNPDMLVGG